LQYLGEKYTVLQVRSWPGACQDFANRMPLIRYKPSFIYSYAKHCQQVLDFFPHNELILSAKYTLSKQASTVQHSEVTIVAGPVNVVAPELTQKFNMQHKQPDKLSTLGCFCQVIVRCSTSDVAALHARIKSAA
jgi:hypothetical protein